MVKTSKPIKPERLYGYVSPHNFVAPVRSCMHLPAQVIINDLTLREGRGVDGVVLDSKDISEIAGALVDLGVPMIQLRYIPSELKLIKELRLGIRTEVLISSPYQNHPFTVQAHRERMNVVMEMGLGLDLCFGSSDQILIGRKERRGGNETVEDLREKELTTALEAVRYAKGQGALVGTNIQDFLRADLDYLRRFCKELSSAEVDLITLDDFAGPAIPNVYKYIIEEIKKDIPQTPIGIHVTNDFGLGTAAVLAAFEGGAEVLDVGINGYGERTGHADLAEVAVAVEVFYGKQTGIKLERLYRTSRILSNIFRVPIPPTKPLVGEMAFADVGEVHYIYPSQPWIFRAIPENFVGNRRRVAFGDKSGPNAIKAKATELGIQIEERDIDKIRDAIVDTISSRKKTLTDEEFIAIVESFR